MLTLLLCTRLSDKISEGECEGWDCCTWGDQDDGGDSRSVHAASRGADKIYFTHSAIAAVVKDVAVVTWGDQAAGGDLRSIQAALRGYSTQYAFAAVVKDWTVVTLCKQADGGDSRSGQASLRGVDKIYSTRSAFAAVVKDSGAELVLGEEPMRLREKFDSQEIELTS